MSALVQTTPYRHFPEKGERSAAVEQGTRQQKLLKDPGDLYFCEAGWKEAADRNRMKIVNTY